MSPATTPTPARQRLMSPPPLPSPNTPHTPYSPFSPPTPVSGSSTTPRRHSSRLADELQTPDRLTPTRRSSAMSVGASADKRRARRAELRQFYGLKGDAVAEGGEEGKAGQGEGQGQNTQGDPLDIDSPAFNAAAYYEDLISKSTLSGLMKTAASLSADIGNLQSSRHALVYNHHHQLFAAGDTISHLNSRTPQLLGIMASLQQSFSEISRLADDIALPPISADKAAEGEKRWKRETERLRLMVLAGDPAEKVKERFESVQGDLEREAEGDEKAQQALEECRKLVEEA